MSVSMNEGNELLSLPNCVHLSERGHCNMFSIKSCEGESCSFVITPEESTRTKHNWKKRLCNLNEEKQKCIAQKYYGGTMPWKGNE